MSHAPFAVEPFRPAWGLANPDAQTLLAVFLRHNTRDVSFRRERIETPDGDFVDIDFADVKGMTWADLGESAPVVLLLHGLEGNATGGYACELYRQLATQGIRAVGLNFRSCSGELNRTARLYHMGATEDVNLVFRLLEARYPQVAKGLIGFSLGANVLINYLGGEGAHLQQRLQAAVAVSPPFDLLLTSAQIQERSGRWYAKFLLRKLRRKTHRKAALLRDKIDLQRAVQAQTLHDFDEVATAPLHGFHNAEDYYRQCSSGQYLPQICVPTLLLRALDDPFFPPEDVPQAVIAANPWLYAGITDYGGHVGFVEGTFPWGYRQWAQAQAARFFALLLQKDQG